MRSVLLLILSVFFLTRMAVSQQTDSLMLRGREIIEARTENMEKASDEGLDLTEASNELEYYLQHPININATDKQELENLGILNDVQIKNLLDYRTKYGIFHSIYELRLIEGMGRPTLEKIMPFIIFGEAGKRSFSPKNILSGRHEIIFRFQRKLAGTAGYIPPADSLQASKTGSYYLGDANAYYLRYRYIVRNKISLGILAEKDAGEVFISPRKGIPPFISQQIKDNYGFDFYSAHLEYKTNGILRAVILGDYHIRCGQGLVLWTGLSFSGGSDPSSLKRYAPGIRANTSSNENLFMRGAAIKVAFKRFEYISFYSSKSIDANISSGYVSSMPNSGYHRTLNEINVKSGLKQQYFGGHMSYSADRFRLGLTSFKTILNTAIKKEDAADQVFSFYGKENLNAGIDLDFLFRKTNLYGEFGYSINGGWALLCGLTHNTENGAIISILFREYRKNYQNFLAQALGRRAGNANERGVKIAMETALSRRMSLQLSTDQYAYPWLTSRSLSMIRGQENLLDMAYFPTRESRMAFRYRYQKKTIKASDNKTWVDAGGNESKHNFRFQIRHMISAAFSIKSQAEYTIVKNALLNSDVRGSLLLIDLFFHPEQLPMKLSFRYALFHTDDYDSRLYAYENDVLNSSSMPAYYGRGFRTYLLFTYTPLNWLQFWLRASLTCYSDRSVIGSGADEIIGNKLPYMKLQLRIKL